MPRELTNTSDDYPTPAKRPIGKPTALKREKKKVSTEMAAAAYVCMEADEWVYGPGTRKQHDSDGNIVPNKTEVMRRAGYRGQSCEMFNKYLDNDDYFWEQVELYRIRRTDPLFRRDYEHHLWREVGGEALRSLYERVKYYPHSLSTEQLLKMVKVVLDAGITLSKMGEEPDIKSDKLLESVQDPIARQKLMDDYRASLERERDRIDALDLAHKGADHLE